MALSDEALKRKEKRAYVKVHTYEDMRLVCETISFFQDARSNGVSEKLRISQR